MNTARKTAESLALRLLALAGPSAESLSDKLRIDELVDAAIEAAGVLRNLADSDDEARRDRATCRYGEEWRRTAGEAQAEVASLIGEAAEWKFRATQAEAELERLRRRNAELMPSLSRMCGDA